jgi:tight adherence protein B
MIASIVALMFITTFLAVSAALVGRRLITEANAEAENMGALLKTENLSTISAWHRLLVRFDYVETMKIRIAEAGLTWSVGRATAMMLLCGAVAFAVLSRVIGIPGVLALTFASLAAAMPYFQILRIREKRLQQLEGQFPDALDSLARAMRSGQPLAAGLQLLAREAPMPLAGELRRTVDERNLGMSWEQALDNLARRVPIVEVSIFAAAVQLQNRTGGKLSEVLGRLAETVREGQALRGEVRSIAAHGRLTGTLLTILPFLIVAAMMTTNPSYLISFWEQPMGKQLIAAGVVCLVCGHLVIRRMVDIRL